MIKPPNKPITAIMPWASPGPSAIPMMAGINIINTIIGALTIVIVQNALNLNAVPTSVQNVVIGTIIVLAVGIDMWRSELALLARRIVSGTRLL